MQLNATSRVCHIFPQIQGTAGYSCRTADAPHAEPPQPHVQWADQALSCAVRVFCAPRSSTELDMVSQHLECSNPNPQAFLTVAQVGSVWYHTQCPDSTMLHVWLVPHVVWLLPQRCTATAWAGRLHKGSFSRDPCLHSPAALPARVAQRGTAPATGDASTHQPVPAQGPSLVPTALLGTLSCPPVSSSNSLLMLTCLMVAAGRHGSLLNSGITSLGGYRSGSGQLASHCQI